MSNSPAWLHPVLDFPKLGIPISVAIGIPDPQHPQQRHSGILFNNSSNENLLLHLGGHEELSSDPIKDYAHFYCVSPTIEEERATLINIRCRTISKTQDLIPYGLFYNGDVEFSDAGEVQFSGDVNGLTCATFVLAVFKNEGVLLIDLNRWQVDDNRQKEDKKFHDLIIRILEGKRATKSRPSEEYINKIKAEAGCARFRPEEVAGASSCNNLPIGLDIAEQKGQEIVKAILPKPPSLMSMIISFILPLTILKKFTLLWKS